MAMATAMYTCTIFYKAFIDFHLKIRALHWKFFSLLFLILLLLLLLHLSYGRTRVSEKWKVESGD